MLLNTPPSNMTLAEVSFILRKGRIGIDEPLNVLRYPSSHIVDMTHCYSLLHQLLLAHSYSYSYTLTYSYSYSNSYTHYHLQFSQGMFVSDYEELIKTAENYDSKQPSYSKQHSSAGSLKRAQGLIKAQYNLEHDFQVVGVMEDMDSFLANVRETRDEEMVLL